jgi:1-acyl-sn-glycerol-3-phosphate acyltransferase
MFLRRIFRLSAFVLANLVFLLAGAVAATLLLPLRGRYAVMAAITALWARIICRILGIRIRHRGSGSGSGAAFMVSNHLSYLDIFVLGSLRPVAFLSRHDVRAWPLLGWLARLGGTLFLDRSSGKATRSAVRTINERLRRGVNVLVFPEATTSDGSRVRAFRSPVFEAPVRSAVMVRPITVDYIRLDGKPFPGAHREPIAWCDDTPLAAHAWRLLGIRRIDAIVMLHEPIDAAMRDRKELALQTHAIIQAGLDTLRAHKA